MRKHHSKHAHFLRLGILFFTISLFFSSCEQDGGLERYQYPKLNNGNQSNNNSNIGTGASSNTSHNVFSDINFLSFELELSSDQKKWLRNTANYPVVEKLEEYLNLNNYTIDATDFAFKLIDIYRGVSDTGILSSSAEHQNYNTITGSILEAKNSNVFSNFDIIFSTINIQNNLNLSDWVLISERTNQIQKAVPDHLLPILSDIDGLTNVQREVITQNTLFIGFFSNLKSLGTNLPGTVEEWNVFFEIMKPEVNINFNPLGGGYDSAIATLNGTSSGDWNGITLGVVDITIEFISFNQGKNFFQLIKHSKKGVKTFTLIRKFTNIIKNALDNDLKIVLVGNTVKFLGNKSSEIAGVTNDIMTFKYSGFGGDIVTTPNKTTTVIGEFNDTANGGGTSQIINSGLSKSEENIGGINALNLDATGMTVTQQWAAYQQWLDDAISGNDIIRSISNPFDNRNLYKRNPKGQYININDQVISEAELTVQGVETLYKKVRDYLQNAGYTYNTINAVWSK